MNFYTYYLYHKPTGYKYYGSKTGPDSDPNRFWKLHGYYSSSDLVYYFIRRDGEDSFIAQVRKIFACPQEAKEYEGNFIRRWNINDRMDWLNHTAKKNKFGKLYEDIMIPRLLCPGCGRNMIWCRKEYCQRICRMNHFKTFQLTKGENV